MTFILSTSRPYKTSHAHSRCGWVWRPALARTWRTRWIQSSQLGASVKTKDVGNGTTVMSASGIMKTAWPGRERDTSYTPLMMMLRPLKLANNCRTTMRLVVSAKRIVCSSACWRYINTNSISIPEAHSSSLSLLSTSYGVLIFFSTSFSSSYSSSSSICGGYLT